MTDTANVRLLAPVADLDYLDSQSVRLPRALSPLEAWNFMMSRPRPMLKMAMRIRDGISSLFGVKKLGGVRGARKDVVAVGDHLDFFLVEGVAPDQLVLTERDRHLDVMTCISTDGPMLTITSSVVTHNGFGRVYMLPVGPAHRMIVRRMLDRLRRELPAA